MRPFNQAGSSVQNQQQNPQPTPMELHQAAPLNANNSGFGGHTLGFTNATGVYEEFVIKSIVCEGRSFGQIEQNFSSEMLRWDDYRVAKQISDGVPVMKTTFDTNPEGLMQGGLPFTGHRETIQKATSMGPEKHNHLYKVFVTHPLISGSETQNFCSEMDRWDYVRETKKIADGTCNLGQTFGNKETLTSSNTDADYLKTLEAAKASTGLKDGRFDGYKTEIMDSKGMRSYCTYKVISCRPVYEGRSTHNISTDMLRWDDYRKAKSIDDGIGSLKEIFDVPLTATAIDNRQANNNQQNSGNNSGNNAGGGSRFGRPGF